MSTSNSQPPQPPPAAQPQAGGQLQTVPPSTQESLYKNPYLHTAALICTPVAFLGLVLPPRRLDFRTIVLGGTAVWGISQLKYDYTGKSMLHTFFEDKKPALSGSMFTSDLPSERAGEVQKMIKEEKARREKTRELLASGMSEDHVRRVQELGRENRQAQSTGEQGEKTTLGAIWMGDADKDWKEKRAKKEQEALQEGGEGIWGLITDQISEVFTRGEKKAQEKAKKENSDGSKSS